MVQELKCKKCSRSIRIDYSKAPKNEFTIACPGCSQKYKLTKPAATQTQLSNETESQQSPTGLRKIPCPKCKTILGLDLTKVSKYPAIISCKKCTTKIRINDPAGKSNLTTNSLDQLKTGKSTVTIDKAKLDPKNNWAYKLYYYTSRIPYLNKVTLLVYLSYLVKSVADSLSEVKVDKIDQPLFLKLRAEVNVMSSQVFNGVVNPILSENGISPRLVKWATSWFVKKVSSRILMNIIKANGIDQNLPFIRKFADEIEAENSAIIRILLKPYLLLVYALISFYLAKENFNSLILLIGGGLVLFLVFRKLEYSVVRSGYEVGFLVLITQYLLLEVFGFWDWEIMYTPLTRVIDLYFKLLAFISLVEWLFVTWPGQFQPEAHSFFHKIGHKHFAGVVGLLFIIFVVKHFLQ